LNFFHFSLCATSEFNRKRISLLEKCVKTREKVHHHDPVVESVGVLSDLTFDLFNTKRERRKKETLSVCESLFLLLPLKMGTDRSGLLMLLLGILVFFSASVQGNLDVFVWNIHVA
jgi:hypothetical protein